jgi:hypothetical protein
MNHILKKMAEAGANDLREAIEEKEPEILEAIQKVAADRDEKEPMKFKLSLAITADLDKSKVETAVSWSVKTTVKEVHLIENGDQTPELKFGDDGEGGAE